MEKNTTNYKFLNAKDRAAERKNSHSVLDTDRYHYMTAPHVQTSKRKRDRDGFFTPYGIQVTAVELGDIHTGFTQARQKVIVGDKEYGGRISRSVSQMEKDEQNGASPEVIGAYIAKIIEKKCKPICVAGAQYKFLSLLCKLLPCGLRGKIVGAIYAK